MTNAIKAKAICMSMNVYVLSCGHNAVGFNRPEYCPKCGAMVDR